MSLCPHATLLDLDNFEQGTPREEIARLRKNHRLVWQEDEYANGGHWLVLRKSDIDKVLKTPADFTNNYGPLLEAELDGHTLTDTDFGRFFLNLIVGGIETTRNTPSFLIHELIKHPEQYEKLQNDPSLAPNAVEEILRYHNTVVYLRRTATRNLEFAGEQIKRGDKLVCILGSSNRDEEFFDRPDDFDITREVSASRRNSLTFGAGGHFCIGVHQARMNLQIMIEEIASRMGNLQLTAEPVHFKSNFMDGYKKMHISFEKLEKQTIRKAAL